MSIQHHEITLSTGDNIVITEEDLDQFDPPLSGGFVWITLVTQDKRVVTGKIVVPYTGRYKLPYDEDADMGFEFLPVEDM